jgi:hypothetical protein
MILTLPNTATKPTGYLPVRAAKVKSMPSAPFVRSARPAPARGGNPVWYETDEKYAAGTGAPKPPGRTALPAETYPDGTRRLRDLPRDVQRPLESRLYHLRKVHRYSEARCSHVLDLHPADLDALAATHGEM